MKKIGFVIRLVLGVILLTTVACEDNDSGPKGEYEKGVFVVNEGNFLDADGTVSHVNTTSGIVTQDIFGLSNDERALGDVVQSMTIDKDLGFIVVNNSNKMEVVNVNTFESVYTLSDLAMPRYFITYKGKGYLTEWVSYVDPGHVAIIDLESQEVIETITTDDGAENIIEHEGELYVSNSSSNTVSVIDPEEEEVIKTIEVGNGPGAFVVDAENQLWVICGGGMDEEWNPLNDGKLVRLNPAESDDAVSNSVTKTIELNMNVMAKAVINKAGNQIFFAKGKSVYTLSTTATEGPSAALITEAAVTSFYGIGIDPETDMLYLADSKAFVGNGEVYRYNTSGTAVDHFSAGRGPNGFAFRK
ncbi:MAG TPA: DUF5074 domain-containing protein [Ohtaekwangia sp.]